MKQHRRQRQDDDDDAREEKLLPFDKNLLNNIASSMKSKSQSEATRQAEFKALGEAIKGKVDENTRAIARFAFGWDDFKLRVLANNTKPLHIVAAAVILNNNNNGGSAADGNEYGGGFFGLAGTSIRSDDGYFPNDLVKAWNRIITQYHATKSFDSFPAFASENCIKDVANYPICKHTQILSNFDSLTPLHCDRFLDSGGIWINSASFLRQTSSSPANNNNAASATAEEDLSAPELPILAKFESKVPNFIGGESGSGKTTAAMIAGANAITLFATPTPGRAVDIASPLDNTSATEEFVSLIAGCLDLECPEGNNNNSTTSLPPPRFANSTEGKLEVRWAKQVHDKKVLVVLDEFVGLKNLRRCFIRCWPAFRTWLQQLLCCQSADQIYLVVLGTGTENFDEPLGSLPTRYRVFTVRAPRLFADLLKRQVRTDCTTASPTQKTFARHLLTLLYERRTVIHPDSNAQKVVYLPRPSDPSTHRFLQLVSNPRCAALAVKQVELTASMLSEVEKRNPSVSVSAVLSYLPSWSNNIAWKFASMNGVGRVARSVEDRRKLIGAALYVVLTNASTLSDSQREVLANKTGLLADTGFWINEAEFDETKHEKVPNVDRDVVVVGQKKKKKKIISVYVFAIGTSRFRMSEAHVALYLLGVGSILSSCAVIAADWKLFEAATADYIMLCWLLNVPVPKSPSFEMTRGDGKSMQISYPAAAFALNNNDRKVREVYQGILQHVLEDESLIDAKNSNPERKQWFEQKKIQWKKMIAEEKADFIFENISNTAFADLIAISEGRITLVQCKHYTTMLSKDATTTAFDRVMTENMQVLEFLADCVGATQQRPCELVVILAVDKPQSFHDETEELFVNRTCPNLNSKFIGSISAKLISAFPNCESDDNFTPSLMFPVLQHPLDYQAIRAIPGQDFFSEHVVLNAFPLEVCSMFRQKTKRKECEDAAEE